jgi:hypothetical protein
MKANIRLSNGSIREAKTRYRTSGTQPKYDTLKAEPGETLGSITERAYGSNNPTNRQKIMNANASLTGEIRVPR